MPPASAHCARVRRGPRGGDRVPCAVPPPPFSSRRPLRVRPSHRRRRRARCASPPTSPRRRRKKFSRFSGSSPAWRKINAERKAPQHRRRCKSTSADGGAAEKGNNSAGAGWRCALEWVRRQYARKTSLSVSPPPLRSSSPRARVIGSGEACKQEQARPRFFCAAGEHHASCRRARPPWCYQCALVFLCRDDACGTPAVV